MNNKSMHLLHCPRITIFLTCLAIVALANLNIRIVLPQGGHDDLNSVEFHHIANITQQGTIRILGTLTYWDFANIQRPLVWARVWVCDREPNGQDYILVERFTDVNGQFDSGAIVNNDGPGEDGLDIVLYFLTWNNVVQVIDPQGNVYYAFDGPYDDTLDGTYNYQAIMPQGHGAWMIFSYHNGIAAGWNYLTTQTGDEAPMMTCRWPVETWPHYHPGGEIHLPLWSCQWPDIILHEYSHFVMFWQYGFVPPSMQQHTFNARSDLTTAWAEGWADFFPLAVFNDPIFTWSNGTHWIDLNLEAPTWYTSNWDNGDEVEGRVAGALWDIFDSQNDNAPWYYDSFSDGFTRIWNIMSGAPRNTFREFWQAWNTTYYARQQTLLAIFQNTIDYRGPGDVNADCEVGIDDINMISTHFGRQIGDPDWDVRRDLNMDGYIGIDDIFIAASNYGNQY